MAERRRPAVGDELIRGWAPFPAPAASRRAYALEMQQLYVVLEAGDEGRRPPLGRVHHPREGDGHDSVPVSDFAHDYRFCDGTEVEW